MRSDLNSAAFKALLAEPAVRAVSFDVFDTALIRTFACPTDLFAELGSTLVARRLATLAPERFAHLRVQAEIQARRQRPEDEPRLSEIYAVLAQRLDWSDEQRIAAELLEISLECSAMVAVPHVRAWIDAARSARLPVAFVSDMYLPASVVRSMLTDQGLARPEDVVLVSCEFRETKARGDLFDRLLEELDLPPDQVLHIGDHPHSDGTVPRAKGFRTLAVRDTALGFCEQRLLAYRHDTAGLSGRLAATARLARLTCVAPGADPALGEIGASLLGPWLTCFALWMFERARLAGITRLYFVSRDGQVMREIALAVQQRWAPAAGIECRYLHGSRIAWHQAAMNELGDHQLRWLLNSQPCVNAAILSARLGLPLGRLAAVFAATPAATLLASPAWGIAEIEVADRVLRQKSAEILALPEIATRRDLGRRYLAQEGLRDDSAWAVVELGWTGSMMVSLHEALGRPPGLTAYYLNLSTLCPDLPAAVRLESFAINPGDVSGHLGAGLRFAEMIEVLTAADHGTVLGYEERSGKIVPRLKTDSATIWPLPALAALREGANQFVAHLPTAVLTQLAAQLAADASARILAHQLVLALADFMRAPPPDLARAFTACRFTEDPADQDQRGFVRPLAFWPVLRAGWRKKDELWAQGSLALTSPLTTALVHGGAGAAASHLWRGLIRRLSPALPDARR